MDPKSGDRVLDIGSGKGEKAGRILQAFPGTEVFAVDPNEGRINQAKRNYPAVKSSVAGAEKLPFEDAYFDKAYSTMALHHFANLDQGLAEITRILKHGGSYVVLEVEPGSLAGRMFRFFGGLMGEHMNIMTMAHCADALKVAGDLEVVQSTNLGPRYLIHLRRR